MFSIKLDNLPGPAGTPYYHILIEFERELYLLMDGGISGKFGLLAFASKAAAAGFFQAITDKIRQWDSTKQPPPEEVFYLLSIQPRILSVGKGHVDFAEYAVGPQLYASPLLRAVTPIFLLRMQTSVKRFVVQELVIDLLPGIKKIVSKDGETYQFAHMVIKGAAAN